MLISNRYDSLTDLVDVPSTPLFWFGEGLTYTSWRYSGLRAIGNTSNAEAPITLQLSLTNTGNVDAAEVVRVYCKDPIGGESNVVRFWKRLIAFKRVPVAAGKTVSYGGYAYDIRCIITYIL